MSPKSVLVLAVLTVLAVGGAIAATLARPDVGPLETIDEPAFPELRERPDAVARIVLETPEATVTLERVEGERWVTSERAGYPVDPGRVRALIVTLADMRLIEPKTRRPEMYPRIEVEDPEAEDANSRLLRLEDADGTILAEVIVGKRRERLTGVQPAGTYLRRPGEAQSWLASGGLDLGSTVGDWLEPEVVDIPAERVVRVEIGPAEGAPYTVVREDGDLTLEGLGEDERVSNGANLDRIAGALAGLEHEDVRATDEIAWPEAVTRARFVTEGGLELELRLAMVEETPWLEILEVSGENADEAEAIAARTGGWAYQILKWQHDRLTRPRDELVEGPDETS